MPTWTVSAFTRRYVIRQQQRKYVESQTGQDQMKSRIMYIERKGNEVSGPARIGRVTFSKSGKTLYYRGREFTGTTYALKANYFDCESREYYWISGCKKRGGDRLYSGTIQIDEDVREEYWTKIRNLPDRKHQKVIRCVGKHSS